jgi:hypothetical protein
VRLLRRSEPAREIILMANPAPDPVVGSLIVPCAGDASVWNPETGEITPTGAVAAGGDVPLIVPGESACFVVIVRGG